MSVIIRRNGHCYMDSVHVTTSHPVCVCVHVRMRACVCVCERSVVEQVSVPEFRAGHAVCLVFDVCVVIVKPVVYSALYLLAGLARLSPHDLDFLCLCG